MKNNPVLSFKKALFRSETTSIFFDYMERMEEFINTETKEHEQHIQGLEEGLESGEIPSPADPHQMPDQLMWGYHQLRNIEEIKIILWHSTILSIYGFLESMLIKHCRDIKGEKEVKDFFEKNQRGSIIKKALKCIGYPFETYPDWGKIESLATIRNCIVHNGAVLKPEEKLKLRNFIMDNEPHFSISDSGFIIVNKTFCQSQMHIVEEFLITVILSPT